MVFYERQTSKECFVYCILQLSPNNDEFTIANKGRDAFSFWPGWVFEEAFSQLIPAVKKQNS